jgi:hypothetical protein
VRAPAEPSSGRIRDALPLVVLAIAVVAFIAVVLDYGAGLNFLDDEWSFLIYRRGFTADAFFVPHGEHIAVLPVVVYKTLLALFGMSSTLPFRIFSTLLLAATAVLLFTYIRRRAGSWLALIAVVLMLFLGPAWRDILWPFEMMLVGSLAAGIGMLMALERGDRRGDRIACALASVSVLCSSLGISFVLAAAIDVALRGDSRGRRAFIPAVPFAVYVVWYATYGYQAAHHVTLHNVVTAPLYLLEGIASALQSLAGLVPAHTLEQGYPTWAGWALLGLLGVVVVLRVARGPRLPTYLWPVVTAGASYWLLAAANYFPGREPAHSRYQYVGAAFVLMMAAALFGGTRRARWPFVAAAAAVAALALSSNLGMLRDARDFLRDQTAMTRADLGAIQIARRTVNPDFTPSEEVAGPVGLPLSAGPYLAAVDELGSPADTTTELAHAPEYARKWADSVLGSALPVRLAPATSHGMRCRRLRGGIDGGADGLLLRSGSYVVHGPKGGAILVLRRFARGYRFSPGNLAPASSSRLVIPRDASSRPWHMGALSDRSVLVCDAGGGAASR